MQPAQQMVWPHYLKPFKAMRLFQPHKRFWEEEKNAHPPLFIPVTESQEVLTVLSPHPLFIEPFNGLCRDGRHIAFMCPPQSNLSLSSCSVTALTQQAMNDGAQASPPVQKNAAARLPSIIIISKSSETFLTHLLSIRIKRIRWSSEGKKRIYLIYIML